MRAIAIVCIRAMGAYFVISAISLVATMLGTSLRLRETLTDAGSFFQNQIYTMIAWAVFGLMGVGMIVWSRQLSSLLTRGLSDAGAPTATNEQLMHVGSALLGLYFVSTGLPDLVHYLWRAYDTFVSTGALVAELGTGRTLAIDNLVRTAIRITVGLGLIAMARPLSRRPFAKDHPETPAD